MRQRIFSVLFLSFSLLLSIGVLAPTSSSASAPAPTWATETGEAADFTWGNWLPCLPEYQMSDCIQSVTWVKEDGTQIPGEWKPKPEFNFKSFRQTWFQESNGESAQDFIESVANAGSYKFEGLSTPCADNNIVIDARPVRYGFQVNGKPTCATWFPSKFEERFEITLKSKNLRGLVGGVTSTGKNPRIAFSEISQEQYLKISANFSYTAWGAYSTEGQRLDTCQKNTYRASFGGWGFWNHMAWTFRNNDDWLAKYPGDMIAGTNGWNCGGNMFWDSNERALVMQVGSPHYDPNGNLIEGWYEGAMRGRYVTAKFGIRPQEAAGNARLEIVYDDGQIKVGTITVKYDEATDWLYLKGYGFTYSNPKLMVKFDPIKQVTSATTSLTHPTNKTIICTKGRTVKKVTGATPMCPKGYKKR